MAGKTDKALLKKRVMEALAPGWIAYVNFTYNGLRVATGDYLRVRRAIDKEIVKLDVKKLSKEVEAQYSGGVITFQEYNFGFISVQKGCIIHEATHCILDIKKSRFMAIEQEIIAFIAEQSYLTPYWSTFRPDTTTIKGLAREIVRNMWKNDPTHIRPGAPALSSYMPEIEALAQMIVADPAYRNIRAQPTMIYENDGVKGA